MDKAGARLGYLHLGCQSSHIYLIGSHVKGQRIESLYATTRKLCCLIRLHTVDDFSFEDHLHHLFLLRSSRYRHHVDSRTVSVSKLNHHYLGSHLLLSDHGRI